MKNNTNTIFEFTNNVMEEYGSFQSGDTEYKKNETVQIQIFTLAEGKAFVYVQAEVINSRLLRNKSSWVAECNLHNINFSFFNFSSKLLQV